MGTTGRYSQRRTLTSSLRTWPPLLLTYPQSWKFRQETWPTTYIVDVYLEFAVKGLHQHNLSIYFSSVQSVLQTALEWVSRTFCLNPFRDDYQHKARKSRTAAIYFNLSIKHYFPKQKKVHWEAWAETEAQIHRGMASYCMTRFQRNTGTRLGYFWSIPKNKIQEICSQYLILFKIILPG